MLTRGGTETVQAPPDTRWGHTWRRIVPRWLREVVLVGLLYGAYELTRGVTIGGASDAYANGSRFLRWERDLHLDPEHFLASGLIHITPLAVAAAYFYSTMHYVITPIVLVWMYRKHHADYPRARTWLAFGTVIGLFGFYFIPTAPPRVLPGSHVPDVLFDVRHWGWWGGDGSVPNGLGNFTNQYAAMPSMHVGWALWCGVLIFLYARRTWVRCLGLAYPCATTLVVLSTGNHYLIDAVAGALVMGVGWLLSWSAYRGFGRLAARRRRPRPAHDNRTAEHFGQGSPTAYAGAPDPDPPPGRNP